MNNSTLHQTREYEVLRLSTVDASRVALSIVIPNYNTAEFVEAAIRSVAVQTFSELEIIVVDDGSSDESIQRILACQDNRLTCIRQKNRGLAGARNTGILVARGEFIGFLDSDDIWYSGKAKAHLDRMRSQPGIGLTFSHSAYLNEGGNETGDLLVSSCTAPTPRDLVLRNHIGNGSTPIVRKDCFRTAGYFDESLRYCEDIEMWLRISVKSGFTLQLIPMVLTGYRVREGSMSCTVGRMVPDAAKAVEVFHQLVPCLSKQDGDRGYAQILRVASRKAFSSGQMQASRSLLTAAWRRSPMLPIYDMKALVLLILNACALILPGDAVKAAYLGIQKIVKQIHAMSGLRSPAGL